MDESKLQYRTHKRHNNKDLVTFKFKHSILDFAKKTTIPEVKHNNNYLLKWRSLRLVLLCVWLSE